MNTVKNANKNNSFENPVMDKCIVRLNEMASVKMASISSKKRPQAKADREAAKYLITVWDDKAALNNILVQETKETTLSEELLAMIKERIELLAEKEVEEEKRRNSPEQKEKEKQEEKAKEEATKAETKAVAAVALSPMFKQFLDLKSKHPDALLLFHTGDFYETYKEDAEKASKILGITLTKSSKTKDEQGKPLAIASFPHHALDTYLPKLIRAGERVAICDQLEAPKQTAKRGITEMLTPSAVVEKEQKTEPEKAKTPAKKSAEDKSVGAPKKYSVGDRHPDHSTWIWTEYKPGKFDWRTDPLAKKKPGAKPKKAETAKAEPKSDKTIKNKDKTVKAAKARKKVVSGYTIEELLAKPTPSGLNKNQKDIRKLLAKGYRLININNAYFLKLETEQKSVDMASLEALLKHYKVEGLPKDIMMK